MNPQELAQSEVDDGPAPFLAGSTPATRECPFCRKLNPPDSVFCEVCQTPLPSDDAPAISPEAAAVQLSNEQRLQTDPVGPDRVPRDSGGPAPYFSDVASSRSDGRTVLVVVGALLLFAIGFVFWLMRPSASQPTRSPASNVVVSLTPESAEVPAGLATDLVASITGTSKPDISWKVQEGDKAGHVVSRGVQVTDGQILFPAVYVAPPTPGTYHVIAASKSDPSKTATATITVTAK